MRNPFRTFSRILFLIVVLSLILAVVPAMAQGEPKGTAPQPFSSSVEPKSHTRCWIYNITIKGYAGGYYFSRSGRLGVFYPGLNVATPNGKNPYEMWIVSGDPSIAPAYRGEMLFTTNTYFGALTPYASGLRDMAYVGWTSTYVLKAVPHTAQNFSYPTNKMRISASSTTSFRWIDQGYLIANFANHPKVSGSVYFKELNKSGTLSATFTGNLYSYSTSSSCRFNNRSAAGEATR
jgi:hypothetical protein